MVFRMLTISGKDSVKMMQFYIERDLTRHDNCSDNCSTEITIGSFLTASQKLNEEL
jgi:hypothetical protein